MSSWKEYSIDDLKADSKTSIAIGPFGSRMKSDTYVQSGVPVIRGNNITDTKEFTKDFVYITPEFADELKAQNVFAGDLVFPHRGNIGTVGIVGNQYPRYVLSSSLMKLTCNRTLVDPLFLFYFFRSPIGHQRLMSYASTVGTPGIGTPLTSLKSIKVELPPLREQKKLVRILSAIDDKIEVNNQINESLESMAKAIFKEWFIDFGPVKAKAEGKKPFGMDDETAALFPDSFKDSELGPIPKGWTISKVKEIGKVICGKTPPTSNKDYYQSNEVPFVTIPDMHNKVFISTTYKYLSRQGAESQENKTLPPGAICVSCIATPGLVSIVTMPSQTNQQINSVIPSDRSLTPYYYHALSQLGNLIKSGGSGGSVFSNLSKGRFEDLDILKPDPAIIKAFSKTVTELMDVIKNNDLENNQLKEIRDLLLPKLISGEIELKELDV